MEVRTACIYYLIKYLCYKPLIEVGILKGPGLKMLVVSSQGFDAVLNMANVCLATTCAITAKARKSYCHNSTYLEEFLTKILYLKRNI